MKKFLVLAAAALLAGCTPKTELVEIYKGDPGTSCSVSQLFSEENQLAGAKVSCTDGTSALILNGETGAQGIQGLTGATGAQGAQGVAGANGQNCSVYRPHNANYVKVVCANGEQRIYDGEDGKDGKNGKDGKDGDDCKVASMSSSQLPPTGGVKITCGNNSAYVKNGTNGINGAQGQPGQNCTATKSGKTVTIACPGSPSVTVQDGAQGDIGPQGPIGPIGPAGQNYQPSVGLACQVYDLPGADGAERSLPGLFVGATPKFVIVMNQLNVGAMSSYGGFPAFSAEQRQKVGDTGYALDCDGYLEVPTTGLYTFTILSDDGSRLQINGVELINHDGLHSPSEKSSSATLLYKGANHINVQYWQGPHSDIALKLDWAGPNFARTLVPSTALSN